MYLLRTYYTCKTAVIFLSLSALLGTTFDMNAMQNPHTLGTIFKSIGGTASKYLQDAVEAGQDLIREQQLKKERQLQSLYTNLETHKLIVQQQENLQRNNNYLYSPGVLAQARGQVILYEDKIKRHIKNLDDIEKFLLETAQKTTVHLLDVHQSHQASQIELSKAVATKFQEGKTAQAINQENNAHALARNQQFINNIPVLVGGISATAALIFMSYQGTKVLAHYAEKVLGKPTLVKESSILSIKERITRSLVQLKHQLLMQPLVKPASGIEDVIVASDLEAQLKDIAVATKTARQHGDPFINALFYGPPGTGKTMFIKALARYSQMEYAVMSGADFSQFQEGDDITELHKLFDWAQNSKKGLLVFVDECDSFLANRSNKHTSQKSINLTNAFLSRVEKQTSNTLMFVFATNHPEKLDSAVLNRIGYKVEFSLPELDERSKIFDLYIKKYVTAAGLGLANDFKQHQHTLVKAMEGLAGRDIDGLTIKIVLAAHIAASDVVTYDIAKKVITDTVTEKKKEQERDHNLLTVASVA
jgi:AAA+ superfamily predicted ATPase